MEDLVLTPTECVALVNQTLEIAYPTVLVEGEVSSFKVSREKYVFFDLKDDEVTLGCFMMLWQLRQPIEDGMRIQVLAAPRLTRWGKFSLNVRQVMPVGQGSIKRAFELLKKKFEQEGLLDASRKRSLPRFPQTIGVIASVESAGYADFLKILNARWGGVEVRVANVQVQGLAAIEQNIGALQYLNGQAEPVDVVAIIRGGGSLEDLSVYNDEQLGRAIAASRIPTIVGVGHEVDTSLADLVSDVRAATPSNAAQLILPDRREIIAEIHGAQQHILASFERTLSRRTNDIRQAREALERAITFEESYTYIERMKIDLVRSENHFIAALNQRLNASSRLLRQLDPQAALKRGYALVRNADDGIITSGKNVHKGDKINIQLQDAVIESEVSYVRQKER
jgi:exodeoxyribonuclease VII large subunit